MGWGRNERNGVWGKGRKGSCGKEKEGSVETKEKDVWRRERLIKAGWEYRKEGCKWVGVER